MMEYFPYTPRKTYKFYRNIIFLTNIIISIILIIIICFGFAEKEHLTENEKNKIETNQLLLGFLLLFNLSTLFIFFCLLCKINEICYTLMIIINIINIVLMIIQIVTIVFIINSMLEIKTFIIICNIFVIILYLFLICLYFKYITLYKELIDRYNFVKLPNRHHIVKKVVINEYRGFKVNDFFLDFDFIKKNKKKQRNILMKNNYIYSLSEEQKLLINLINEFRDNNGFKKLNFKEDEEINYFIKIGNRKNLSFFENILKLGENKYLFIYPMNEFKNKFLEKDYNILNILKNEYLNEILIVERLNNEYILVFESVKSDIDNNINFESYNFIVSDDMLESIPILYNK